MIVVVIGLLLQAVSEQKTIVQADDVKQAQEQEDRNQTGDKPDTFEKESVKMVLTEYERAFLAVVHDTNDTLKLNNYTTKQELVEYFQQLMSVELATSLVDAYFTEKKGGLFVVATEPPTFLEEGQPFTVTTNGDGSATVTQEHNNDFMGHVQVEFTLAKQEDRWMIIDVQHNYFDD